MQLYELRVCCDCSEPEGADSDEYFGSLKAAKTRRAELIRQRLAEWESDLHEYMQDYALSAAPLEPQSDFAIDQIAIANLRPKALLLAALNRRGYVAHRAQMIAEHDFTAQCAAILRRHAAQLRKRQRGV